ncbi:GNAT family N-acetyltransferase [Vibrio hannami]|uniref:GNAT family N-acetyltransferase n=1 Tax=Vibrio hannami TaxID=2717094 RepID=UPI003EBDCD85
MNFKKSFVSNRISFSPIQLEDSNGVFDAISHPNFPPQLPLAQYKTKDATDTWCKEGIDFWKQNTRFVWTGRDKTTNKILGQVTLTPNKKGYFLAYWVNPDYWNCGIATEMCSTLIEQLRLCEIDKPIWASVHNWNAQSNAVLSKLGFELDHCNVIEGSSLTRTYVFHLNNNK